MIVPVRCDRCRQTAEEAGTEIDEGLCANCWQDLHDDAQADEVERAEPAGVGYTEDF